MEATTAEGTAWCDKVSNSYTYLFFYFKGVERENEYIASQGKLTKKYM
jgi:hypothetical protein